jgi:uncharacterized protein
MKVVYDPPKRLANLLKHGLDFADLEDGSFFEAAFVRPTKNDRYMAIGWLDDVLVVAVVFKPLGAEALSVVSMRPASRKERSLLR